MSRSRVTIRSELIDESGDLLAGEGWRDLGACSGIDPEVFFPDRGESTKVAKAICDECIVSDECLEYALDRNERFGIWGGLSARERRRIRAARRKAA